MAATMRAKAWNRQYWNRPFQFLDQAASQPVPGSQAEEKDDGEMYTQALLLEDILAKHGLILGLKYENRKIIINLYHKNDPADYFPLTAWAALSYRQGAWLRDYFKLPELAARATCPALQ